MLDSSEAARASGCLSAEMNGKDKTDKMWDVEWELSGVVAQGLQIVCLKSSQKFAKRPLSEVELTAPHAVHWWHWQYDLCLRLTWKSFAPCLLLDLLSRSWVQVRWGWKTPHDIIYSNFSAQARSNHAGSCPVGFWVSPRLETPHLSVQPVSVFNHPQSKKKKRKRLFSIYMKFLFFPVMPTTCHAVIGHHWDKPDSIFPPPVRYLCIVIRSSQSLFFSGMNSLSCHPLLTWQILQSLNHLSESLLNLF